MSDAPSCALENLRVGSHKISSVASGHGTFEFGEFRSYKHFFGNYIIDLLSESSAASTFAPTFEICATSNGSWGGSWRLSGRWRGPG